MAETPSLTPQRISAVGNATADIPRIAEVPSLRSIGRVEPTGYEAQIQSLGLEGQMLRKQAQNFGVLASDIADKVRKDQQLQADKIYSQRQLAIQNSVIKAQQTYNPESDGSFAGIAMGIHDNAVKSFQDDGLTEFQRKYLQEKFDQSRLSLGTSSMRFQTEYDAQSQMFDYQEHAENLRNLVIQSPDSYNEYKAQLEQSIDLLDVTGLEKKKLLETQLQGLAFARGIGLAQTNPYVLKETLKRGDMDQDLDPYQKIQLQGIAENQIDTLKLNKIKLKREQEDGDLKVATDLAIQGKLTPNYIVGLDVPDNDKRALFGFMNSAAQPDNTGNPKAYQDLYTMIVQNREAGKTTPMSVILKAMTPASGNPLNPTQFEDLRKEIDGAYDSIVGTFMKDVVKPKFGKKGMFGSFDADPDAEENMLRLKMDLNKRLEQEAAKPNGLSAVQLLTPGSPYYIGNDLISQYKPTPAQIQQKRAQQIRSQKTGTVERPPINQFMEQRIAPGAIAPSAPAQPQAPESAPAPEIKPSVVDKPKINDAAPQENFKLDDAIKNMIDFVKPIFGKEAKTINDLEPTIRKLVKSGVRPNEIQGVIESYYDEISGREEEMAGGQKRYFVKGEAKKADYEDLKKRLKSLQDKG